jgi:plastocyanin
MEGKMSRKLRWGAAAILLPALLLSLVGPFTTAAAAAPGAQTGAQTWSALTGAEIFTEPGEKSSWQAFKFYPASITINAGDTITWKHNSGVEPHTVTFLGPDGKRPEDIIPEGPPQGNQPPRLMLAPNVAFATGGNSYDGSAYVNSGVIAAGQPGPQEFGVTFPKAGTYNYICVLHSVQLPDGTILGMKATVVVQAAGSTLAKTPAQVMADAEAAIDADEAMAAGLEPEAKKVSSRPGDNGTTIYTANAGFVSPDGSLHYMRFAPPEAAITVGDTIEWITPGPTTGFHTVTFGDEPEFLLIEPQPSGPPKVVLNPLFLPAGDAMYEGSGYHNSGPIFPSDPPPGLGVLKYSLTFTEPGRYEYICITHYLNGMDATVTVGSTGGGPVPGMPTTGSGLDIAIWLAIAGLGFFLAATGLALRFRRSGRTS